MDFARIWERYFIKKLGHFAILEMFFKQLHNSLVHHNHFCFRCDLAFMLGQNCFSVQCKDKSMCFTTPAQPSIFNPQIAYVKTRSREGEPSATRSGAVATSFILIPSFIPRSVWNCAKCAKVFKIYLCKGFQNLFVRRFSRFIFLKLGARKLNFCAASCRRNMRKKICSRY